MLSISQELLQAALVVGLLHCLWLPGLQVVVADGTASAEQQVRLLRVPSAVRALLPSRDLISCLTIRYLGHRWSPTAAPYA